MFNQSHTAYTTHITPLVINAFRGRHTDTHIPTQEPNQLLWKQVSSQNTWKHVSGQNTWKQIRGDRAQGLLYLEQTLRRLLSLFWLHLFYNGCLDNSQNRERKCLRVLDIMNLELHLQPVSILWFVSKLSDL